MLPSVDQLGVALLGVFAAKEVWAFGQELVKLADDFNNVKEAEEALKAAGDENLKIMEESARVSETYAKRQELQLRAMALAAGQESGYAAG